MITLMWLAIAWLLALLSAVKAWHDGSVKGIWFVPRFKADRRKHVSRHPRGKA